MDMEFTNVLYRVLFTSDYVMCFTTSNNYNIKYGIGLGPAVSGCFYCFKHNIAYVCLCRETFSPWQDNPHVFLFFVFQKFTKWNSVHIVPYVFCHGSVTLCLNLFAWVNTSSCPVGRHLFCSRNMAWVHMWKGQLWQDFDQVSGLKSALTYQKLHYERI